MVGVRLVAWDLVSLVASRYDAVAMIARRRNETLFPPPNDHPFSGARDAKGHWGYVADPTSVRTTMLARFQLEQHWKSDGSATATDVEALTMDDMIAARYMPLTSTNELNETELICQKPPGKGVEGKKGGVAYIGGKGRHWWSCAAAYQRERSP